MSETGARLDRREFLRGSMAAGAMGIAGASWGTPAVAAPPSPQAEADAFLAGFVPGWLPLLTAADEADWAAATDVGEAHTADKVARNLALNRYVGAPEVIDTARRLLEHRGSLDDRTIRQLEEIRLRAAATVGGWANRPAAKVPPLLPLAQRGPTQVTRLNPIPSTPAGASTRDVNLAYQRLLAGTVWRNYQLVITQWPTKPDDLTVKEQGGIYPQDCGQPFPVDGCANVTLETYLQSPGDAAGAGGNSCMSCHYTAGKSDFSWVLQRRAH